MTHEAREAELERKRQETERLRELGATSTKTPAGKSFRPRKSRAEARAAAGKSASQSENARKPPLRSATANCPRQSYARTRFAAAGPENDRTPAEEENSDNSETGE